MKVVNETEETEQRRKQQKLKMKNRNILEQQRRILSSSVESQDKVKTRNMYKSLERTLTRSD